MARLLADENFPFPVVEALRRAAHDVVTVADAGKARQALTDKTILELAVADRRAVVTLNRRHFVRLHAADPNHAGIIVFARSGLRRPGRLPHTRESPSLTTVPAPLLCRHPPQNHNGPANRGLFRFCAMESQLSSDDFNLNGSRNGWNFSLHRSRRLQTPERLHVHPRAARHFATTSRRVERAPVARGAQASSRVCRRAGDRDCATWRRGC